MNKLVKKLAAGVLAAVMTCTAMVIPTSAAVTSKNIGALLDSYSAADGTFTLTSSSRIFIASTSEPTDDLLQTSQLLHRQFREMFPLLADAELVWGPQSYVRSGDIVLVIVSDIAAEGYELNVSDAAVVYASDTDGLIYGANMLMKFLLNSTTLSGFIAADAPDTKERAVQLDVARKYYTVEWICNFIRQMSWMGYNSLTLHFSEDGGFRADFWDPTYYNANYNPENDFSWLCGSHIQSWVKDPYRDDPDAGKYLTTAELIEIINVAKEYHIDIVPSFDSPAHMDYISWKFEQNYKENTSYSFTYNGTTYYASSNKGCINYTDTTGYSSPKWPYYTTVNIKSDMAKAFVFAIYEDIADFFKEYAGSVDFAIGADEVNLSSSYGPLWSYSDFPGYINELNRILNAKGYTCRMYNDFIGSTTYNQSSSEKAIYSFDPNIEIMYWNSDFNPSTGKWTDPTWHVKFFWETNTGTSDNWGDGGRTMYNCIQTNCYYVLRIGTSGSHLDARDPDNRNWTFYHSNEEDIYNEWYPADISEKGVYTENAADVPAEQLGGAYFLIWNDYAALNTEAEVWNGAKDSVGQNLTYYIFDRMASNIIKMWNADVNSTVNYDDFAAVRDAVYRFRTSTPNHFPGFTGCSKDAELPDAVVPERSYLADHSALIEALKNKISNDDNTYTADSYADYEEAYAAAEEVCADYGATEEEVAEAVENLQAAAKALKYEYVADHTALTEALKNKISNADGTYTAASYAVYENAYTAAEKLNADYKATEAEMNAAIKALQDAKNALKEAEEGEEVLPEFYFTLVMTSEGGDVIEEGKITALSDSTDTIEYYLPSITGYSFLKAVNGTKVYTFTPLASNDGSGFIKGSVKHGDVVCVLYADTPNSNHLKNLIANAYTDASAYTSESWDAYAGALTNAQAALSSATQAPINAAAAALIEAGNNLVAADVEAVEIISIMPLSKSVAKGKNVNLRVTTSPNADKITIDGQTIKLCTSKIQTLSSGDTVKVWVVSVSVGKTTGSITYTLNAAAGTASVSDTYTITVK
ncbi:MAG: family 20 glycosylhydrolase [Clostridia bacterium]|nr:family 20 glycosylhydrolase [Clostridia bacterium]